MKKAIALTLATSLLIAGCASSGSDQKHEMAANGSNEAIAQAKADLDEAIAMDSQWRVIDKATGSTSVDLATILKKAEEELAAGNTAEAERLAKKVSEMSKLGVMQHKQYAGTKPYYN